MKAVVVLGADEERCKKRAQTAFDIILGSKYSGDTLILTGKDWRYSKYRHHLKWFCKRFTDVRLEEELYSENTRENAIYSLKKMGELGISKADIIVGPSQAAVAKRHFNRYNKDGYKLNFYAAPEGLKVSVRHFPWEMAKYIFSFVPQIDAVVRKWFSKVFT